MMKALFLIELQSRGQGSDVREDLVRLMAHRLMLCQLRGMLTAFGALWARGVGAVLGQQPGPKFWIK